MTHLKKIAQDELWELHVLSRKTRIMLQTDLCELFPEHEESPDAILEGACETLARLIEMERRLGALVDG